MNHRPNSIKEFLKSRACLVLKYFHFELNKRVLRLFLPLLWKYSQKEKTKSYKFSKLRILSQKVYNFPCNDRTGATFSRQKEPQLNSVIIFIVLIDYKKKIIYQNHGVEPPPILSTG